MTSIEQGRLASLIRRHLLAAHMLGAVLGIGLGGMLAILVRHVTG